MHIYISTGAFQTRSLPEILNLCKQRDIDQLELSSGLDFVEDIDPVVEQARQFGPLLIHNYFPAPAAPFVLNLASSDDIEAEQSMRLCRHAIDLCERVGAPFYSVHSGFVVPISVDSLGDAQAQADLRIDDPEARETAYEVFGQRITQLSAYAAAKHIRLLIENNVLTPHNISSSGQAQLLMASPAELVRFFNHYADGNLGLLLDVGHLNVAARTLGLDRASCMAELASYVEAFHLSDNDGLQDSNQPISDDAWYLKHLKHFPDATFVLEAYNLSLSQIKQQRDLISRHILSEAIIEHEID